MFLTDKFFFVTEFGIAKAENRSQANAARITTIAESLAALLEHIPPATQKQLSSLAPYADSLMRVTEDLDRTTKDHSHLLTEMKTVKDFVNARLKSVQDSDERAFPASSQAGVKSTFVFSKQPPVGYFQKSRDLTPLQVYSTGSSTVRDTASTNKVSHHLSDKLRLFSN